MLLQARLVKAGGGKSTPLSELDEQAFYITEDNWKHVIEAAATRSNEVMFSTFTGADEKMVLTSTNLYFWAWQAGVAHNVLLMSSDEESCVAVWEAGVPCWVDNYCPRGDVLPKSEYPVVAEGGKVLPQPTISQAETTDMHLEFDV